ncbi:hypothetical protein T08_16187 [Trichinella sp. T8]|nr:hypothetical protein T08_16187 [Trichinella sp. T8]
MNLGYSFQVLTEDLYFNIGKELRCCFCCRDEFYKGDPVSNSGCCVYPSSDRRHHFCKIFPIHKAIFPSASSWPCCAILSIHLSLSIRFHRGIDFEIVFVIAGGRNFHFAHFGLSQFEPNCPLLDESGVICLAFGIRVSVWRDS